MTPIIHLYGMTFGHICTFNCIGNENKVGELKIIFGANKWRCNV